MHAFNADSRLYSEVYVINIKTTDVAQTETKNEEAKIRKLQNNQTNIVSNSSPISLDQDRAAISTISRISKHVQPNTNYYPD